MIGCSNVRLVQRVKERKYKYYGLCFQLEDENRDATGTGNRPVRSRIPYQPLYRPVETSFFRPVGLEIYSIFSWILGQFLQKSRVEIFCFACQTSSVDVCDKVY